MSREPSERFLRFLGAGALGFVIDTAVFVVTYRFLGWNPYLARSTAFFAAVLATWLINRQLAFKGREAVNRKHVKLVRYMLASVTAGACNLGCYAALVSTFASNPLVPYLALPVGVAVGLGVNFWLYSTMVFRAERRND